MKISIRISILTLFTSLIMVVGGAVLSINYHFFNKLLINLAKSSMEQTSTHIKDNINNYLTPLNNLVNISAELIKDNVIHPGSNDTFRKYLVKVISGNPYLRGAYWASSDGSLFLVEKQKGDFFTTFFIDETEKNPTQNEAVLDDDGNIVGDIKKSEISFDPLVRPWYQQAKFKKKLVWSVFPLKQFYEKREVLGLTVSEPLFVDKRLRGVVGIDITLNSVEQYINSLPKTKNMLIFVCDEEGRLLNAYELRKNVEQSYYMPKIEDLHKPWAEISFDKYQKSLKPIFIYSFQNKKYIASYTQIKNMTAYKWYVAIITPEEDIVGPLKENMVKALLLIIASILCGILLMGILSGRISKPIKKLSKEAFKIQSLNLSEILKIKSSITEIDNMGKAFESMKNSLISFSHYLPITLIKNLMKKGEITKVGGETKTLTFLFSDIENFATISESLTPEELMNFLSEYFDAMTKVILKNSGTLDKYIGDGIMAFWGAPIADDQHFFNACKCAIELKQELSFLNEKWKKEGRQCLKVRIGINTGEAVVGNVGSSEHLNYTVLGDAVNLASRLEGLNKFYGTYVAVGESTYERVKNDFAFRLLDLVAVKGRANGSYVYELMGEKGSENQSYNGRFKEAFDLYQKGDFSGARSIFSKLEEDYPNDPLIKVFKERVKTEPPKNWSGCWIMGSK